MDCSGRGCCKKSASEAVRLTCLRVALLSPVNEKAINLWPLAVSACLCVSVRDTFRGDRLY